MEQYQEVTDIAGEVRYVMRLSDEVLVPIFDERNADYLAYLEWRAVGNTPLPA